PRGLGGLLAHLPGHHQRLPTPRPGHRQEAHAGPHHQAPARATRGAGGTRSTRPHALAQTRPDPGVLRPRRSLQRPRRSDKRTPRISELQSRKSPIDGVEMTVDRYADGSLIATGTEIPTQVSEGEPTPNNVTCTASRPDSNNTYWSNCRVWAEGLLVGASYRA